MLQKSIDYIEELKKTIENFENDKKNQNENIESIKLQ